MPTSTKTLNQSAASLAISEWAQQHASPLLVITEDSLIAAQLENELDFFLSKEIENKTLEILHFPDWETLLYDRFSPHEDLISERLATLANLQKIKRSITIVSVTTLLHRIAPKQHVDQLTLLINKGDTLNIDTFREGLVASAYHNVNQVINHGEFSVRGSIIDIFPMGAREPYRIDLFDTEVESIRTFDPDTQRTLEKIDSICLLPAKEFPLTDNGINHFRKSWRDHFDGNPMDCPMYLDLSKGVATQGIEYYLPLFFENTAILLDYLRPDSTLFLVGNLEKTCDTFWLTAKHRYQQLSHDRYRPILPPEKLLLTSTELLHAIRAWTHECIDLNNAPTLPDLSIHHRAPKPLENVERFLNSNPGPILLCAESIGRREVLIELLKTIHIYPTIIDTWAEALEHPTPVMITVASITQGWHATECNITLIAENQLFGERYIQQKRRRKQRQVDQEAVIKSLAEIKIGDPVVHLDKGVGRFLGLEIITLQGEPVEFLALLYANDTKLYVPITSLHLISRYTGGDPDNAPLHNLGSDQWAKAKRKAAEKIRDLAAELLLVYAERDSKPGFTFKNPQEDLKKFCAEFPFEETPDQQRAIDQVLEDMFSTKAMDRLVCGDVGFGKTEVAMRACFVAVMSGKQVAVLVPTTLLASQHFENFKDRFADWPVNIQLLSRFVEGKVQDKTIEQLKTGKVDIVIGTHKLLQDDVKFHNLGLLVIDEEHRFGVQQKERIKKMRAHIDILTLTATPIPRTLNMAMSGIRDISIIATPPAKRLSIKTFVKEVDNALIRESILREIMRGGQVFYLYNEVETIEKFARDIEQLVPEARIGIGHGQMRERELEQVMSDFYHRRFNVLVCSTIIENGIDIPTANTILIHRADKFGLAQLHQLRGRVGRSHHQAYAYLLTPPPKALSKDAQKRLDAIESLEDLGAGFTLATHDLEIRGAGELLGEGQSGNMEAVGFSLYMELLERTVEAMKHGKKIPTDFEQEQTEVDLAIPALIPDDYMGDIYLRLQFYKRIASAKTAHELSELQIELIDRFGLLPPATKNLFVITSLKNIAAELGIEKITGNAKNIVVLFRKTMSVDPSTMIALVMKYPTQYQFQGGQSLKYIIATETAEERLNAASTLLSVLASK